MQRRWHIEFFRPFENSFPPLWHAKHKASSTQAVHNNGQEADGQPSKRPNYSGTARFLENSVSASALPGGL